MKEVYKNPFGVCESENETKSKSDLLSFEENMVFGSVALTI